MSPTDYGLFSGFRLTSEQVKLPADEISILEELQQNIIKTGCQPSCRLPFVEQEPHGNSGVFIENDHIVSLFLFNERMKKIPKCIGSLKYLKILYIYEVVREDDEFSKIPDSIEDLSSLSTLFIRGHDIDDWDSYKLPKSFSKLQSLKTLVLEGIWHFPEFIIDLKSLKNLQIHDSRIRKILPEHVDMLKNLNTLGLERNKELKIPTKVKNALLSMENQGCRITPDLNSIPEILSPKKMTEAELIRLVKKAVELFKKENPNVNEVRVKNVIDIIDSEAEDIQKILRILNDISAERVDESNLLIGIISEAQLRDLSNIQIDKIQKILSCLHKLKITSFQDRRETIEIGWITYWFIDFDECRNILKG